MEKSFSRKRLG